MIKLAVSGCRGKMGEKILKLAEKDPELEVVGAFDIGDDALKPIKLCDVLIDFTAPEASVAHAQACLKVKRAIVIGTTGLDESQVSALEKSAKKIPVVFSPNMSVGVNCLFELVEQAAKKLGSDYKVKIVEAHHVHKKDAPSGTAKKLAQIIEGAGADAVKDIESIREDEIVGNHRVILESDVDTIELSHSAKTRDIFALGALKAAKFVVGKPAKLYTMKDVLL